MGKTHKQKRDENVEDFNIIRMLSQMLPEKEIVEQFIEGWEKYQKSGNKEDRPMQWIVMLSVKWGDEAKGRSMEDAFKNTEEIADMHMLHNEMKDIKKSINDD